MRLEEKYGYDTIFDVDDAKKNLAQIETEAMASSCEEFLACLFIMMADNGRYKPLKTQLENDFLLGKLHYPKTVVKSKRLLSD